MNGFANVKQMQRFQFPLKMLGNFANSFIIYKESEQETQ